MKKSLIALAALAVVSAASAQSTVTIYGQLDAGIYSLGKVDGSKNALVYGDGAAFSNVVGFKGFEDLGNGLAAKFQLESDIQTNNGGSNAAGMFRRQANVSLASAAMGEVKLGVTNNPLISTFGLLMPVAGNMVSTASSTAIGFADFYTKNAVTYFTPNIAGFSGVLQRGFSQNLDSESAGSVTAYSLAYVNGPLEVRYAGQDRKEAAAGTAVSGANPGAVGTNTFNASTGAATVVAATASFNKKTNVLGAKYTIGQYSLAAAYISNEAATTFGGAMVKKTATQVGLGYTTGPWTLGTSLASAESSTLLNVQARYALSKRTNPIAMYGSAKNDANATVKFLPTAFNTGTAPAVIINGLAATAGVTQTALGLGITHSF